MAEITLKEACIIFGYKDSFLTQILCRDTVVPFRVAGRYHKFDDGPEFRIEVRKLIKLKLKSATVRSIVNRKSRLNRG